MLIAGDIGGTKARLGLFEKAGNVPKLIATERYNSKEYDGLESIIRQFLEKHGSLIPKRIETACFGLPGPVVNGRVKVTNLPWEVIVSSIEKELKTRRVKIVNDLVSTAAAVPHFTEESLVSLYEGRGSSAGTGDILVVAPGTGLGHALIHRESGGFVFLASEGGHANFAPTDDRQVALMNYLKPKLGHVSVESVLCGPGLYNIYCYIKDTDGKRESDALAAELVSGDKAAIIARCATQNEDENAKNALSLFCTILGAHCSNMVLNFLATGGVFLGGGIPPKIIDALQDGAFVQGFLAKKKCLDRVEATSVQIIKNDQASLLGAAAIASTL